MKKNFLISTGGSGGHVIPATIFYDHLSKKANIFISTDKRGLKYLDKDNYKLTIINTPKLNNIIFLPFNIFVVLFLTFKSFFLLRDQKIEKVFSTGGYMSIPLILAARYLNLEIYLIEPNQVLGRSNRFFLRYCKKIFCYSNDIKNFPQKFKSRITTINPLVRENIYGLKSSNQINNKCTILVVGGSQVANFFDKNLKNLIINISKKKLIKIIQQTNEKNINHLSDFYSKNNVENRIFSFDKDLSSSIEEADLCISRAGASTLAELSVSNTPFIAVPLPNSKDNHQFENANFYRNNDCCWLLDQITFEEKIEDLLKNILNNKSDFLNKKQNLKKLNYQNTWKNVNQKLLRNINEN